MVEADRWVTAGGLTTSVSSATASGDVTTGPVVREPAVRTWKKRFESLGREAGRDA